MSELTEEWKRFRQEFGNFLCKLDNVANRAIAADEQRKKYMILHLNLGGRKE